MEINIEALSNQNLSYYLDADAKDDDRNMKKFIETFKSMYNDERFTKDIEDYDKNIEQDVELIKKTAVNKVKTDSNVKTAEDIMDVLNIAQEDIIKAYNDYRNDLKTYIMLYIHKVK